jgi:predicted small secreted protein
MRKGILSMQKIGIVVVLMGLSMIISGCTKTWNGVKQDSSKAWDTSKKAVHNATE